MAFQESAESLRAKLHLSKVSLPLAVGVCCLVALAFGVAAYVLWGAIAGEGFSLREGNAVSGQQEVQAASLAAEPEPAVTVHVSGAVAQPGLYELPESARVNDAVEAAGGMADNAARDALNLARIVTDGEQIVVPTFEEHQAAQAAQSVAVPGSTGGKVNINTATVEQLDTLPGVGPSTAEKIIADREANGPFSSPEDLKRVSGIGDKKYAELADLISVG